LIDLGASINLMPLSMLKRNDAIEVKPTRMTLNLVYRSIKCPYEVIKDVLVKVDFKVSILVYQMPLWSH